MTRNTAFSHDAPKALAGARKRSEAVPPGMSDVERVVIKAT